MKRKIFKSILLTSILTTVLCSAIIFGVLYNHFYQVMKTEVQKEALYIDAALNISGEQYLVQIENKIEGKDNNRLTLIASDGTVIYDNYSNAAKMENHLNRPEVQQALRTGSGEATRMSATIGMQTYYYAMRLDDGNILRVSCTIDSIFASIRDIILYLVLIIALIVAFLSMYLAKRQTASIVKPINDINLDQPLSNDTYEEIAPLLTRIEKQHRQINKQISELTRKQEEFAAITENMNEGLILLNSKGLVLSINKTAAGLFGIDIDVYIGKDIITIDRSLTLQKMLKNAYSGVRCEEIQNLNNKQYQLIASPVQSAQDVDGVILLIIDVTERNQAEQMRREFTANVSHELKTPLHSISGCAEIIKNGLVKPDDINHFIDQIYSETQRLIMLVDDIINLSKLDETSIDLPKEKIDIYKIAQIVIDRLQQQADNKQVQIYLSGGPAVIRGVTHLIDEIIYNLCDNAIKYNHIGGRIDVSVIKEDDVVILSVTDTGIGIVKEQQERIFERFYRVESSHSKQTGGTGLGLAIVKHAAKYHNAIIKLQSKENQGTTVTVQFPLDER